MDPIIAIVEAILANIEHSDLATLATDQERADAVLYGNAVVLSTHDLDATESALTAAARQLLNATAASDDEKAENLQTAKDFAAAIEAIRTERGRRAEVDAAHAAEANAVLAQIDGAETLSTPTDPPENGGDGEGETPAPEGEPETPAEPQAAATLAVTPEPEVPSAPAVTRPRQVSLAAVARAVPAEVAGPASTQTSVLFPNAQLDVPGFHADQPIPTIEALTAAMISRHGSLGRFSGGSIVEERVPVGRFDYLDRLHVLSEHGEANMSLVAAAMQAAREGDSLVAAGGFCAPAENVYGFAKVNQPSGLAQDFLPTLGAPRGRVQFPTSPDIRGAFTANPSRRWTETNDIDAGNTVNVRKAVTTIPCPAFVGCQVEAQYEILKFGNIGARTYPEWVQHWIGLSADVHAHKVSEKLIGQMLALSNAVVAVGPNGGATATLFSNLALAAADMRSDLRMADDATLEVMLPIWTDDLIRSDLFRARKGDGWGEFAVTDAQIAGWFAALDIVPRYVTDWQTVSGNSATGATVWPSGLSFMIFPPGTFVKLDQGTLDIGVVRDSTLNQANDFHIFNESFEGVCKPGIESRVYSTSVCATGAFSADQNLGCSGVDIAGS